MARLAPLLIVSPGQQMLEQFDGMSAIKDYAQVVKSDKSGDHSVFYVYLIRTFSENYKLGLDFCDLLLKMDKFFTDLKKLEDMQVNDNCLQTLLIDLKAVDKTNDFKKILVQAQDRTDTLVEEN